MSLSKNLKKIRKEHNLSQEQLADKLGVSRQSVSKWESDQAYPEMDKMISICKMFNLNIDELLNQDVGEINETKQSRININKYIDDFLNYITKTIDMFSSMRLGTKIKCIFEQFVIIGVIALILLIIGSVTGAFVQDILMILPEQIYFVIYRIIKDIYLILCFILSAILVLYIFKIRYLDYYIIDKTNNNSEVEDLDKKEENAKINNREDNNIDNKKKKIYLEKKQTKVIIRDPDNSGYKFISLLFRGFLFLVKMFVVLFASMFCFSLVGLCFGLVLTFLFIKTGLVFVGVLFVILSMIILNLIILNMCYNFIISKKVKKSRLALFFCISLVLMGIGSGLFVVGLTGFDIVDNSNYIEKEVVIPFREDLFIWNDYNVSYIPSDNDDLRIVYRISDYYEFDIDYHGDGIVSFYTYSNYENFMDVIRESIKNINDKRIVDYSSVDIDVYTSDENIEKINNNKINYFG